MPMAVRPRPAPMRTLPRHLPSTWDFRLRTFRRRGVDELEPAPLVLGLPGDHLVEALLQRLGDRPAAAAADLDAIDGADGGHLGGGSTEEHLIRDVQHFA